MDVKTPDLSVETTFSSHLQLLQSQNYNFSSHPVALNEQLTRVTQASQTQQDLNVASFNSLNQALTELADKTSLVQHGLSSTRAELYAMVSDLRSSKPLWMKLTLSVSKLRSRVNKPPLRICNSPCKFKPLNYSAPARTSKLSPTTAPPTSTASYTKSKP